MNEFRLYDNKETGIPKAADEHKITITAHTQNTLFQEHISHFEIVGFLSEEFSYSSQAQYENMVQPQAPDLWVVKVGKDEIQKSMATYGWLTKKTYSNSSSQALTIKFRSVSHSRLETCYVRPFYGPNANKPIPNPVVIAEALMSLTMNTVGKTALFNSVSIGASSVGTAVKSAVVEGFGLLANGANIIGAPLGLNFTPPTPAKSVGESTGSALEATKNAASHPIDTLFVKNPLVVELIIGNIFKKDYMVVKNVDVTFSKEFHTEGVPLYADFTVTLESLFNSSNQEDINQNRIFGTGLTYNRVRYQIEVVK